jgi:polysaccharide export outer membrane protein
MKLLRSVLFLVFSLYLISCGTQKKLPTYLQNATDTTINGNVQFPELKIQKNDILFIQVYSASISSDADALYNLRSSSASSASSGGSTTSGFLVDAKGNIEYPRLGTFHAEGLTKDELAAEIKKRLTEPVKLLESPTVIIRFQNLKITVVGEVNTQGVVSIPGERVTILEAIGLAGGISEYGIKDAVKVIRETDGKREIGVVDLSSSKLFESPFYVLRQNDVILVDPTDRKAKKAESEAVVQRVSFGLSIVTAIALLYNIFK